MPSPKIVAIVAAGLLAVSIIGGFILIKLTTQPLKLDRPKIATSSALFQPTPKKYTISFDGEGFVPENQTINLGDIVTVKNSSKTGLILALGEHENHTPLKGFEEKLTKAGESYSFTPQEKGTFDLHNHLLVKKYGKLIIN